MTASLWKVRLLFDVDWRSLYPLLWRGLWKLPWNWIFEKTSRVAKEIREAWQEESGARDVLAELQLQEATWTHSRLIPACLTQRGRLHYFKSFNQQPGPYPAEMVAMKDESEGYEERVQAWLCSTTRRMGGLSGESLVVTGRQELELRWSGRPRLAEHPPVKSVYLWMDSTPSDSRSDLGRFLDETGLLSEKTLWNLLEKWS